MALTKKINLECKEIISTPFGIIGNKDITVSNDFYITVYSINGNKNNINIEVLFKFESLNYIKNYNFTPILEGDNFIKQAYLYLKSLEEYADAEDC